MNFKEKFKRKQGITLIALVVTIIVLLILAGITIAMLTGQNGILNRATEARDANGIAQIDEQVKLAVAEALSNGLGTITDENLRAALDNNVGAGNYTLTGDATNGWTIKAGEKTYKISGNGDISGGDNTGGNNGGTTGDTTKNPNYSEDVADKDIIPELFLYEIIDENARTARIVGMNPKYCSGGSSKESGLKRKYATRGLISMDSNYKIASVSGSGSGSGSGSDSEVDFGDVPDTNYEIIYNGKKISDTLIVPDKYVYNGKEYTITETCISVTNTIKDNHFQYSTYGFPKVLTVIYPNTVLKIYGKSICNDESFKYYDTLVELTSMEPVTITRVVLPNRLKELGEYAFLNWSELTSMNLPSTIEKIGNGALCGCGGIEKINIDNISEIGMYAFALTDLKEIDGIWPM